MTTNAENGRATGLVKWFKPAVKNNAHNDPHAGYGFIAPDDSSFDVLVLMKDAVSAGLPALEENQRVSYRTVEEKGKKRAIDLKLL